MFTVPLIPPDLRHEETIIQAAHALDCLQKTINTIFERIDKRIEKNNVKVGELQGRINKSQEKIKNLQGTRSAIHIYAPARFPASHIFKEIPVTFKEEVRGQEVNGNQIYEVKSKVEQNLPNINEKLVFFHVRENHHPAFDHSITKGRTNIKQTQDLGTIPKDLRSISSVLLFNSDYSPYSLEEIEVGTGGETDNWKRAKLFKSKRLQKSPASSQTTTLKQILEPAPHSLAHRNEKLTPSGGLKYTPKLSEAPELNLPMDLPDLPGIADDLRYESQEAKQKIAPSLEMVVESLPDLEDLLKETRDIANISMRETKNDNVITVSPNSLISSPPPPPPPLPPTSATTTPPPPPPPPLAVSQMQQIAPPGKSSSSPDTRSELMEAIRNAGGAGKAHLRRTAAAPLNVNNLDVVDTQQTDAVNNHRKSAPSNGGGLMADLHNKLLMRRKGISGSKDNSSGDQGTSSKTPSGNPVISRLSSLIPPPPPVQTRTTSEDEDDSNDAEWVD